MKLEDVKDKKCYVYGCNRLAKKMRDGRCYCAYHYSKDFRYGTPYGPQNTSNEIYLPEFPGDVAAIKINVSGEYFIFDAEDLEWLQYYIWQSDRRNLLKQGNNKVSYAYTVVNNNYLYMHRLILIKHGILSIDDKKHYVDHKNRIKRDNRKSNLRLATPLQNVQNRNSRYKYQGISFSRDKFHVTVRYDGKIFKLEQDFDSLDEAKEARDRFLEGKDKEFAVSNNLDDGVYQDKVNRCKKYDEWKANFYSNKDAKKAIYFNYDRLSDDYYYKYNRSIRNLPEYDTSFINSNDLKCCVCGKRARSRSSDGKYYCSSHNSSMRAYGQPFGKRNLSFEKITYLRNVNNTGLSALITSNGGIAMLDAEDYDKIIGHQWQCSTDKHLFYYTYVDEIGLSHRVTLAKVILGLDKNSNHVTFKNGLKYDFRKSNLYPGNAPMMYYDPNQDTKDSHRGVFKTYNNKYQVRIRLYPYDFENFKRGETITLGTFSTFEEAVQVRLDAEKQYYGYTFEDMILDRKIYEEFSKQVKEWLDSFDSNVQPIKAFYFLGENPNQYPKYMEAQQLLCRQNAQIFMMNKFGD